MKKSESYKPKNTVDIIFWFNIRPISAFVLHETIKTLFGSINDCFISRFKVCSNFDNTATYMWNKLA